MKMKAGGRERKGMNERKREPLISISRKVTPLDKLGWKVITLKGILHSSAPVHFWAPERSRIVDPISQDLSWGSG
jgi:hypothetical protein